MWDCCYYPCGSPTCHFPIKMAIFQLDFFEACTCVSCSLPWFFFQSKFFNQSFGDESAQYPKEFFHQRAAKMFSITLRISSGYQLTFQSDELLSVCQTVLLFKGLYVQCNLDLGILNIVTTCDKVTIFQTIYYIKPFDLVTLCDLVTVFAETKSVTKSRLHCTALEFIKDFSCR